MWFPSFLSSQSVRSWARFSAATVLFAAATGIGGAQAQTVLTEAQARAVITPFYDALNADAGKDAAALVMQATGEGWMSCSGNEECKPREAVAKGIAGFGQAIPNLKWVFKDIIVSGNKVIVRGEGSGTPAGDFMGVSHTGSSFKLMAIDIHTIENGKMVGRTYHVEDWMGAVRQLRAPAK